jgi:hypothetical protein
MIASFRHAVVAASLCMAFGGAHAAGGGGGSAGADGTGLGTPNGAGANGEALPSGVTPPVVSPGPRFKHRSHKAKKGSQGQQEMDDGASAPK